MKTLIATLLMALFAQGAIAQIESGTFRIGPTFEYTTDSDDDLDIKSSDMKIGVNTSYFIIQNLGVGLEIRGQFSYEEEEGVDASTTSFAVGPHVMYMIGLSEKFYVPIYASYLFSSVNLDLPFVGDTKGSGNILGFGTGIEYLVGNKLGLRLNVGYEIISLEFEDFPESSSESSGIRSSIGVGIYF